MSLNIPSTILKYPGQCIETVEHDAEADRIVIRCRRDKRVKPVDSLTGLKGRVHRRLKRTIQDVPFAGKRCYVEIEYAQVALGPSSARVEQLEFVDTRCRVTRRYARMISGLCRHMSLCVVSRYTGIRWESVKEIDKQYLKETLPAQDPGSLTGLRYLGVDEVARCLRGMTI